MGNVCCDAAVDSDEFKKYCMETASNDYKPFITKVQTIQGVGINEVEPYSIEGDWQKGYKKTGKGVIFSIEKFYYEGPIVDGKAQGTGKIVWPNRFIYTGGVEDNKASGEGQLQIQEKALTMKGSWVDGFPKLNQLFQLKRGETSASITFVEDNQQIGQQKYFKASAIQVAAELGPGLSYQGELRRKSDHYEITGEGTLKFGENSYYTGELEGGKMHGTGKYFWGERGHWYEGFYKDNFRNGIGRYYYNEDEYDMGLWVGGRLLRNLAESIRKRQGESIARSKYEPIVEELRPIPGELTSIVGKQQQNEDQDQPNNVEYKPVRAEEQVQKQQGQAADDKQTPEYEEYVTPKQDDESKPQQNPGNNEQNMPSNAERFPGSKVEQSMVKSYDISKGGEQVVAEHAKVEEPLGPSQVNNHYVDNYTPVMDLGPQQAEGRGD